MKVIKIYFWKQRKRWRVECGVSYPKGFVNPAWKSYSLGPIEIRIWLWDVEHK